MNNTALYAHGLSYRSGDRLLLDEVSLSLPAGERLAIVGPNGAGKTTLLRLLAGLLKPTSGAISLLGRSLREMRPVERARLAAIVGQTDQPDGRVKVWDFVGLGRIPHSGVRSRTDEWGILRDALERTGLSALRDREIGSLSGGERQRCQIARALAQEPRILFLDEPTNHLDPRARHDLLSFVSGLGLTVVAVLHDLALVPVFATSVAIIKKGRLAAFGPPSQALSQETVRDVFELDVLRFRHPEHGRELTVFDLPSDNDNGAIDT